MRSMVKGCLIAVLGLGLFTSATTAFAQKMKMKDYEAALQAAKDRLAKAEADVTNCETEKAGIQTQITDADAQAKKTWQDIYALIGTDEAGVEAYRQKLAALESELEGLAALSPEELYERRAELDDIENRLNELKESRIYALTEMQNRVASIEGKITQLRDRMPTSMYGEYTVMNGDHLWMISRKDEIYGDPFQWIRIYSVNADQIKDPDLIFPDQVFQIQKGVGPDEYLVEKGDFLHMIAGKADVYGDPTQWTKLYEENKASFYNQEDGGEVDASIIYPYQVLRIPR